MTSSPGLISARRAAISVACVQEVVRRAFAVPVWSSIHLLHFLVNSPSPLILWFWIAFAMYSVSFPVNGGILKLIIKIPSLN